ncbi:MAG: SpoIIE family protein phosphatase [Acidobacteriota bacterium]|nr:SpoIIE family protein phosphatase [Acidobacteriota bacterium]
MSARRLFVLLAPLAAVLGMFLAWRHSTASRLQLEIAKDEVVRIARAHAAAKGVDAAGWNALVDLQPDNDLRHYLAVAAKPAEREAVERIVSPVPYRCVLVNETDTADSVHVSVSNSGRLISYRVPPTSDPRAAKVTEAQARQIAEQELRTRLGEESAGFAFAGMGVQQHKTTTSEIRRFTFRRQYGKELAVECTIDTSGAKTIGFKLTPRVSPEHEKRFPEFSFAFVTIRGIAIIVLVVATLIYVITRFIRRSREHEVPLKRAAIVASLVFVAFAFSTLAGRQSQRISALEQGPAPGSAIEIVLLIVVSSIMATLVGVTWGACEADLREAYPEKLTSTDALLGGMLHSRAVRSSLITGLALAGYAALLLGVEAFLRARLGVWATIAAGELMAFQSARPGLVVIMFAFTGLPVAMGLMLAAVSATHRKGHSRNTRILLALLVFFFFFLTTAGNYTPAAWTLVQSILAASILLVPFLLSDVLAVIVVSSVSAWAILCASLIAQPAAALRSSGWTMLAVLVAIIAAAAIAAFRRRATTTDIEAARPEYARNIAERLMLTTEMDAARQAQLRVMPRVVPDVAGVTLAARHSASAGIETDSYEFFPSATHLGVAVADARLPGLSSALCISMLKGLLLNYAARLTDPRDLADRVYKQLSSIFGDDLPLSFFFGRLDRDVDRDVDRAGAAFTFATFGAAPHAIHVRAGAATSLEGEEYVELERNDAVVIYNARLAEMRDRDGALLGDDAIRAALAATNGSDPQKLVDAIFDLATRHSRGVEAQQTWIAVAIAPNGAEVTS